MTRTGSALVELSIFACVACFGVSSHSACPASDAVVTADDKTAVLRKLKRAIDDERLLEPEFFSEASIKSFFCVSDISWLPSTHIQMAEARGYRALYGTPARLPESPILVEHWPDQGKSQIVLPNLAPEIDYRAILQAFGDTYSVADSYSDDNPLHPHLMSKSTSELGNKTLTYQYDGKRSKTVVYAYIDADGSMEKIVINQEEKKE